MTQRPAPADNTPVTVADRVVVRAGAAVSAPVLDNDVSPSGRPPHPAQRPRRQRTPGQLEVVRADRRHGRPRAGLRLGPPGALRRPGEHQGAGHLRRSPTSRRTSTGKRARRATLRSPWSRPTTPTTHRSRRPSRVVWSPATRSRSACPGSAWTATATRSRSPASRRLPAWAGSCPSAATSSSTRPTRAPSARTSSPTPWSTRRVPSPRARCASPWCEPGQPQPPLAVADRLTVEPGRTATFDPLANDFIAPGTPSRSSCSTLRTAPSSTRRPTWSPAGARLPGRAAGGGRLPRHQRPRRVARDDDPGDRRGLQQPADRLRRLRARQRQRQRRGRRARGRLRPRRFGRRPRGDRRLRRSRRDGGRRRPGPRQPR